MGGGEKKDGPEGFRIQFPGSLKPFDALVGFVPTDEDGTHLQGGVERFGIEFQDLPVLLQRGV